MSQGPAPGRAGWALPAVLLVALAARTLAAALGRVSDDLVYHGWMADAVLAGTNPYLTGKVSWPPLWALWCGLAGLLSRLSGAGFGLTSRLLPFAADAGVVAALWRRSRLAALAYALHPVALTTTGAQANFEAIPALTLLLAVLALEGKLPAPKGAIAAGLWLGLGASFKTWPALLAPALALTCRRWPDRLRLLLPALALPALCSLPFYLADPAAFRQSVFGYSGFPGWWGFTSLGILFPGEPTRAVAQLFASHGKQLGLVGLGLASLLGLRLGPRDAVLAVLLVLYSLTPGLGPQHLLWIVPVGLLARGPLPVLWQVLAGLALLVEFFVLPRFLPDPSLGAAQAQLLVNLQINWLRFPVFLTGLAWLARLLWQAREGRPAPGPAAAAA